MALTTSEAQLLQETHDATTTIVANCVTCHGTVAKHDRVLYGNSRWGLVIYVRVIWGMAIAFIALASVAGVVAGVARAMR